MWCVFQVMCDDYMAGQVVPTVTRASNTWTVIHGSKYQKKKQPKGFNTKHVFSNQPEKIPVQNKPREFFMFWSFLLFLPSTPKHPYWEVCNNCLLNHLLKGLGGHPYGATRSCSRFGCRFVDRAASLCGWCQGPRRRFFVRLPDCRWMNLWFGWEVVGIIQPSRRQYVPGIAVYTGNWVIVLPTTFYKKPEISSWHCQEEISSCNHKFSGDILIFRG